MRATRCRAALAHAGCFEATPKSQDRGASGPRICRFSRVFAWRTGCVRKRPREWSPSIAPPPHQVSWGLPPGERRRIATCRARFACARQGPNQARGSAARGGPATESGGVRFRQRTAELRCRSLVSGASRWGESSEVLHSAPRERCFNGCGGGRLGCGLAGVCARGSAWGRRWRSWRHHLLGLRGWRKRRDEVVILLSILGDWGARGDG